ncbi:hypothetical protein HY68_12515 [Streptomyces sp. AcH 505]|uniref:DUF6907 domain-containing protein n=1 Tax=Streptomyces sp. AcH 505 TaxID=352211 RepID=UPI000591D4C5|nr:hypothetical protein HY68_12515 [Streptomyces sp. AcH 505]
MTTVQPNPETAQSSTTKLVEAITGQLAPAFVAKEKTPGAITKALAEAVSTITEAAPKTLRGIPERAARRPVTALLADIVQLRDNQEDGAVAEFIGAVADAMQHSDDPAGVLDWVQDMVSGPALKSLLAKHDVRLVVSPVVEVVSEAILMDLGDERLLIAPEQRLSITLKQARAAIETSTAPVGTRAALCPQGYDFCVGENADHSEPREVIHRSTEHTMSGVYGTGLMTFQISQWDDDEPEMLFCGDGDWPTLDLDQTDELIEDMATHLTKLRAARAELAAIKAARA